MSDYDSHADDAIDSDQRRVANRTSIEILYGVENFIFRVRGNTAE